MLRIGAVVVGLALVVGLGLRLTRAEPMRVSAMFNDTTGLYVGNDVRVLGVDVGKVTAVKPSGTTVRVDMEFPDGTEIPSNADAAIMQSSLVTDRFVELTPAYRKGEQIAQRHRAPAQPHPQPGQPRRDGARRRRARRRARRPARRRQRRRRPASTSARRTSSGQGRFIHDALQASQGAMDAINDNRARPREDHHQPRLARHARWPSGTR